MPGGIIADEFPTIYIHKIDNVVVTARSNRVGVLLGLQEIPQLRQFYKKKWQILISAIVGNILSGSARDKIRWNGLKIIRKNQAEIFFNPFPNKEQQPALTKKWIL